MPDPGVATDRQALGALLEQAVHQPIDGLEDAALQSLEEACRLCPDLACLEAARLAALRRLGRHKEAVESLRALLEKTPRSLPLQLDHLAVCWAAGDLNGAREASRQLLATHPDHLGVRGIAQRLGCSDTGAPDVQEADRAVLIGAAEQAYAQGHYQLALEHFRQALASSPHNPDLEAATARCLRQIGDLTAAERVLQAILERLPGHFAACLGMAELERGRNHHAQAAHWYGLAVEQQPDNVPLLNTLARSLLLTGESEAAAGALDAALQLDPENGELLAARIELWCSRGELAQALEASNCLLTLQESSPWHRLRHVGLLRQLQRPAEALACLELFDAGDDPKLRAHGLQARGVLMRQLGQLEESLTVLREAVRLDPICPDHAVALASLLSEIGAFQEGLDGLQESERRIGAERGLAAQP